METSLANQGVRLPFSLDGVIGNFSVPDPKADLPTCRWVRVYGIVYDEPTRIPKKKICLNPLNGVSNKKIEEWEKIIMKSSTLVPPWQFFIEKKNHRSHWQGALSCRRLFFTWHRVMVQ